MVVIFVQKFVYLLVMKFLFVCCLSSWANLRHYKEWKDTDAVETLTMFLDTVISDF